MSVQHQPDVEQQNDEQPEQQTKQKRPPYAQLPHYVLIHPTLSPGDRELYAHLDTFWRDKDVCWPSQRTLAERMGVNVCTVHRRAKKLADAKLIEVKRQGLNNPNKYVRLPLPRSDLRVVPEAEARDDQPDLAEMQDPDLALIQGLDLARVQYEADAVEADEGERDKSKPPASAGAQKASPAVRALVDALEDADDGTYSVFAKAFLPDLHDGYFEFVLDELLDKWRPEGINGEPVRSETALAYDTLDRLLAGPGVCGMPARYHLRYSEPW